MEKLTGPKKIKTAVFISGKGSNFNNLIKFSKTKKSPIIIDLVISNRCYVGFSMDGSLSSFVHGNLYVRYQSFDGKHGGSGMIQSSFFKNLYRIQNSFVEFKKSELFFVNPTSKKLNFSIENNRYSLEKGCSILIDVSGKEDISILSRCLILRPIIFNYKDCFFDVYHG